jgi:hypothetical protein
MTTSGFIVGQLMIFISIYYFLVKQVEDLSKLVIS